VASDLLKEFSGTDEFQQSLGQIRDGRQNCETFFDDALMRLELTLNEAVREQQAWEEQRTQTQSELDGQAAELERRQQELQAKHDHFFDETLAASQKQYKQGFDELAAALGNAQQQFQQQIQQHLEELPGQNGRADGSPDGPVAELESRLKEMEEERTNLLQGRSVLEAELETLRQRAAELMGTIEEQKHSSIEQQNQLTEELRQQRKVLELVLKRMVELESLANATAKTNEFVAQTERADAGGDSVLSSVLAQFEVLQKDVARRRNETVG
jgi:DNA repair exonuclease SbcCD ATPase subunit